jgi:hypothetical protein
MTIRRYGFPAVFTARRMPFRRDFFAAFFTTRTFFAEVFFAAFFFAVLLFATTTSFPMRRTPADIAEPKGIATSSDDKLIPMPLRVAQNRCDPALSVGLPNVASGHNQIIVVAVGGGS